MTYAEKLKDPRWQKKRLEILNRDNWICQQCYAEERTLHVHHRVYAAGKEPWDIEDELLITLCDVCHEEETKNMKANMDRLTKVIKSKFYSSDLLRLCDAFENIQHYYAPEVTASIIEHWLGDAKRFELLGDKFFEHLHEERVRKELQKIRT